MLFFLSLYSARLSFEYYQQVYFIHRGLQDESLLALNSGRYDGFLFYVIIFSGPHFRLATVAKARRI